MSAAHTRDVVFNVVWVGPVFEYLQYFVASLIAHSDATFRFVINGCTPESVVAMEKFAAEHSSRVVELFDASSTMVPHGIALDAVFDSRDDGDLFCFVDSDIKANGPFLGDFFGALDHAGAVTSGTEVWSDNNVVPAGHVGLGGRHFYGPSGFVYGSPHLAMYQRDALRTTRDRWDVGLGSAGPDVSEEVRSFLAETGHPYLLFDTGKIVNILLQADGHRLTHIEHASLVHIGGLSHYLSPPAFVEHDGVMAPDWVRYQGMEERFRVSEFAATMLRELVAGRPAPSVPSGLEDASARKLILVRAELADLIQSYQRD